MPHPDPRATGFTLTELMIALAVAGVLAALAYPAYTTHTGRARRDDGRQALLVLTQRMEQHRERAGTYVGAQVGPGGLMPEISPGGHYRLTVLDASADGYRLAALPQGVQAEDSCATLTLDHLGTTAATGHGASAGTGRCWP